MSQFNRLGDFFEGGFDPESDSYRDDFDELEPFTFNISFPEAPDHVNQNVKLVKGRLVISVEFVFDDIELLDWDDDEDDE